MKKIKAKFIQEHMMLGDLDNPLHHLIVVELDVRNKPIGIIIVAVPKPYLEFPMNPYLLN